MSTYNRVLDRDEHGRLKRHYRRPAWPWSTPGWWVREHMNQPRWRIHRHLCHQVALGHDPEAMVWPLGNHRPHVYYW